MTDQWLQITINPHQVTANLHERLEKAVSMVHLANDQPLFSLGLFESLSARDDGSRVYFLTPGSAKYLQNDLKPFQYSATSAPKASEVRSAVATFYSLLLLDSSR